MFKGGCQIKCPSGAIEETLIHRARAVRPDI